MAVVTIITDASAVGARLTAAPAALPALSDAALAAASESIKRLLVQSMADATPKRTGKLAASATGDLTLSPGEAVVTIRETATTPWKGADFPYVRFVVQGTAPHDIFPATKRALFWPGAEHPVSHVHHPGTAPNDFPTQVMEQEAEPIRVILRAEGIGMAHAFAKVLHG